MEAVRESRMSIEEGEEVVKCRLCERAAVGELCVYHQEAMERVKEAYPIWVSAYGTIEWKDYLDNVKRNVQTGRWAKESAEFLERIG
jgi:hypothetical protein